jgi:hypothetical protein
MGLHLLYTLTLSVILMSTCFANINLSKSWGRKERSLPFAYSRLLWRCVIQTYCDVISEMLVARISVIFTSRGLRNRLWFRLRVRVFLFKCRVSNPSSLIDLSAPHSQTMKPTICCAHWYLFYINVSKWMRIPEIAEQQNCKTLISGVWHVQCRTLSASGKHSSCERTVRQVLSKSAKSNNKIENII